MQKPASSAFATSANQTPSADDGIPPRWAVLTVTWVNSLGSGILWSGVPFITETEHGFTKAQNLALALAESVIYVVVALAAGPLLRRLSTTGAVSPRSWLVWVFVVQIASSCAALLGTVGVVVAACCLSACGAALWPVMESYVSAGRHGHEMRRSIGLFNATWMSATAASLLLMAPLMATGHANASLPAMVPVSVASIVLLRWFPRRPAEHPPEHAHRHLAPQYPYLLRATRFVIPASYVFIAALSPVLPFLLRDLGVAEAWRTPLTSTWMVVRVVAVLLLASSAFWHGKWSALVAGISFMAGGFATIALAPSAAVVAAGLAAFGIGHGILYYAGLYYAMAVGNADVDAGGRFEALIGLGYVVGPLAGMAATGSMHAFVAAILVAAAAAIAPAALPWLAWRRHARLAAQGAAS